MTRGSSEAEPPQTITQGDVVQRWLDVGMYDKPPLNERLSGLAARVSHRRIVQPRPRRAGGEAGVRRGPGHAGLGVPQRSEPAVRLQAVRRRQIGSARRRWHADDRAVHFPRRARPGLSGPIAAAGAGFLLSRSGVPPAWRSRCCFPPASTTSRTRAGRNIVCRSGTSTFPATGRTRNASG